jgi:hypothetical protein
MRKSLFTCAALAVLSTSAFAGNYYSGLNIYGGYNFADSDCVIDDAPVAGLNFHTFLNDNFGIRAGYERVIEADLNKDAKTLDDNDDTTNVNRFALNAIIKKAQPWKKMTPYFLIGGGYEDYEDGIIRGNSTCSGQWFGDVGVGAGISLGDKWAINPEVRALYKEKCETVDIVPTIGLTYLFGGGTRVVEKVVVKEKIKEVKLPCPQQECIEEPVYDPKEDAVR